MKAFSCSHCGHDIYFENVRCVNCGRALGFSPAAMSMMALEAPYSTRRSGPRQSAPPRYCGNAAPGVCNWLIPAGDPNSLCLACRHNRLIPNLNEGGNLAAWASFERAKKRLFYGLLRFGLPLDGERLGKPPLIFDFVEDAITGHEDGVITVAVAEADPVERERQRVEMRERYRSLLGHFRHEIGHYYWMLLVDGTNRIEAFRQMFGDERQDYAVALESHHHSGPPPDWPSRYISAYASAHPWEDWAETWAHYMHLVDALDTARAQDIEPRRRTGWRLINSAANDDVYRSDRFDPLFKRWVPLSLALNSLNRSMGHGDFYPFVIPPQATAKLDFIHRTVRGARLAG
jgi:hypothetical protein